MGGIQIQNKSPYVFNFILGLNTEIKVKDFMWTGSGEEELDTLNGIGAKR